MSGSYLLDTNIIIGLFAGQASIINHLQQSDEIFIPSIALGELHYGAWKSGRVQQNLERIEEFVVDVTVIDCDAATAPQLSRICRYEVFVEHVCTILLISKPHD